MQLVLIVGTKQQHIISILATEAQNDALGSQSISASKKSTQAVTIKTRDELFWFNYPGLLLLLIHFILFQVQLRTLCQRAVRSVGEATHMCKACGEASSSSVFNFRKCLLCVPERLRARCLLLALGKAPDPFQFVSTSLDGD